MKSKGILSLAILAGVPFVMVLGNSMLIPVLPKMKSVLHITQLQTGLIITLFSIPAGLTIPFAGVISDRLGRKAIIVPALLIYALGGLISGFAAVWAAKPYFLLLLGRIVQGIGAAGTAPIAMALAGDIFTQERSKAMGFLEAANGFGKVVSPIFGALAALIAWYTPFFIYPVLCLPIAAALWFGLKEPRKEKSNQGLKKYFDTITGIFGSKGLSLIAAFAAGMVALFLLFGVLFYFSDILEEAFKVDGIIKGFVIAVPVLAMSITSLLLGAYFQKKPSFLKLSVVIGLAIVSAVMAAVAFLQGLYVLLALFVIMGIGVGMVLPALNLFITSSTSPEERGMITALYGGVRFIGVALGPPTFAFLLARGKILTFLAMTGLSLAVAALAFFFMKLKAMTNLPKGGNKPNPPEATGKKSSLPGLAQLRPKTKI